MVTITPRRLAPVAATALAPVSWGTTYITIGELFPHDRPLFVAATRLAPAGAALLAVAVVRAPWRPRGAEWGRTALLGLANFALFMPLLIVAVDRLPGGVAAAMGGVQPLLVTTISSALDRRRPSPASLAVGAVAAIGVALVVMRPGTGIDAVGVLAALGANISFAIGVVATKRFPAPPRPLAAAGWQLLVGALLVTPLMFAVEGRPPAVHGRTLAGIAYLSLVATALASALWFRGIRRLPTPAPPLLGLAAPITGATLGWVVHGESLTAVQLIGFAMTVAAIAYGATLAASRAGAGGRLVSPDRGGTACMRCAT